MKTTKEKAEIMLAFDRGERVLVRHQGLHEWRVVDSTIVPTWNWNNFDYRIAEKPKEKIKMLCWTDGTMLHWRHSGHVLLTNWKRFPAGDKEGEVGE